MDWVADIGIYAIPAFLLLIAIEFVGYYRERKEAKEPTRQRVGVNARDVVANLTTYGIGTFAAPLAKFIELPILATAASLTPLALSASDWWVWVLTLLLADFGYYFEHRMSHRIRLFWAGHSVHHSSQHFNLTTALRLPWLMPGQFLLALLYVPMALVGVPLWMIFLSQSIVLLYQFPIHTERIDRLPRAVEYLFNTPSHHRVHHGANNPYLDKNYAGILIIWDRMFGTYAEELEPVRYGLTKNINSHNPFVVNYHGFATMLRDVWLAKTWRGKLDYLRRPPGWSETPAATNSLDEAATLVRTSV